MGPLRCPVCRVELAARALEGLGVSRCPSCDGMAVNVAVVRARVQPETVKAFWAEVARDQAAAGQACPSCERPMRQAAADGTAGPVHIDVCTRCQLIWFDPAELEALPTKPREREIPLEAKQHIAREQVRMMGEQAELQAAADRARDRLLGTARGRGLIDLLLDLLGA